MTGEPPRTGGGRRRVGDFPALVAEAQAWPAVLEALEGDVYEAEETLARGRADEIAAWGAMDDAKRRIVWSRIATRAERSERPE